MKDYLTFRTVRVRVPESREVRIPHGYAHDFASMPLRWRTVHVPEPSKYLDFPLLDPATARALNRWRAR